MSFTFKQYHAFLETPLDEQQLDEIWPFKNQEEKEKVERQKLELMAKKGDLKAKIKLADLEKAEKLAAAHSSEKDKKFADAKAHAEVADRGSSRAYDRETGSARSKQDMRWDPVQKKWAYTWEIEGNRSR